MKQDRVLCNISISQGREDVYKKDWEDGRVVAIHGIFSIIAQSLGNCPVEFGALAPWRELLGGGVKPPLHSCRYFLWDCQTGFRSSTCFWCALSSFCIRGIKAEWCLLREKVSGYQLRRTGPLLATPKPLQLGTVISAPSFPQPVIVCPLSGWLQVEW